MALSEGGASACRRLNTALRCVRLGGLGCGATTGRCYYKAALDQGHADWIAVGDAGEGTQAAGQRDSPVLQFGLKGHSGGIVHIRRPYWGRVLSEG